MDQIVSTPPPDLYIEAQTPDVMVFEDGAFGR